MAVSVPVYRHIASALAEPVTLGADESRIA